MSVCCVCLNVEVWECARRVVCVRCVCSNVGGGSVHAVLCVCVVCVCVWGVVHAVCVLCVCGGVHAMFV